MTYKTMLTARRRKRNQKLKMERAMPELRRKYKRHLEIAGMESRKSVSFENTSKEGGIDHVM